MYDLSLKKKKEKKYKRKIKIVRKQQRLYLWRVFVASTLVQLTLLIANTMPGM